MTPTRSLFLETLRLVDGIADNPDLHRERMRRALASINAPDVTPDLSLQNLPVPPAFRHGCVKCRIVYGPDGLCPPTFEHYTPRVLSRIALVDGNGLDYGHKYADRSGLARLLALRGDCDDILIVQDGHITDLSFANVVFRDRQGGLVTPSRPLLPGTRRRALLSAGVIAERPVRVEDLGDFVGFYPINAMMDLGDAPLIPCKALVRTGL
ncbi:aminotransferase class IV [Phaeovibrio sulfidiphilus]|uniref:Probable branched-chain-amino-acid aminotransferase n=1 Tax=Phaeovibrio sulfidiphilus TaxID=1220600 RepID=A0A8J6YNG8_9PROT|nr:aminotransferase class IV [Phaeovibrio sulfidiphilus]MBE1237760.1 aminotransferase class IV [Phaeovibrio sulfidiphilus]